MEQRARSNICPTCGKSFIPWGIWRVTRWTFLRCPSCGGRLGRKLGLQFWLISIIGIVGAIAVVNLPLAWYYRVALVATILLIDWLIDVVTVRLIPVDEQPRPSGNAT